MAETQSGQGILSAAQQDVRASVAGFAGVSIQATGTFTGTISFEGSIDGVNFAALLASPIGVATAVTSATAAGLWTGTCAGLQVVRVRMSAFSSGTVLVHIKSVLSSPGDRGAAEAVVAVASSRFRTGPTQRFSRRCGSMPTATRWRCN